MVLGAGGAARAVTYGLLERGVESVFVANRTERRADELVQRFGARVRPVHWQDRDTTLADASLFVNTTTLGMTGQPALTLDIGLLPDHAIVVELVYVPLVTPLLRGRPFAGIAHRRRARHADASGGARLYPVVREKAGSDGGIAGSA